MLRRRFALWAVPQAVVTLSLWFSGESAVFALWVGAMAGVSAFLSAQLFDQAQRASLQRAFDQAKENWGAKLRQLEENSHTLTAVMDGISEGLWVTDKDGNVIRHNRALKEMIFSGQALLGQRPLSLLRNNELNEAVQRACQRGEAGWLEVTLQGLRHGILSVHVTPLAKDVGGSTAVFHDVTELRRLEKVRKDFVANVSHELRTPITAIRGYAETLREGALKDPAHSAQMVEIIHRQSERLSELVEDLLELSRLEAKEHKLQEVPVNLRGTAFRAAEAVRLRAEGKGLSLTIDVPDNLWAKGDPRAVEQALQNLLDNAVKYTPSRGQIRVTGGAEGQGVQMSVQDTGVGIEAHHLGRVFERFYRVDKGRSREMGGTGLGLAIVKHLVGAMRGDIRAESQIGQGSTFTVSLPGTPPPAENSG